MPRLHGVHNTANFSVQGANSLVPKVFCPGRSVLFSTTEHIARLSCLSMISLGCLLLTPLEPTRPASWIDSANRMVLIQTSKMLDLVLNTFQPISGIKVYSLHEQKRMKSTSSNSVVSIDLVAAVIFSLNLRVLSPRYLIDLRAYHQCSTR